MVWHTHVQGELVQICLYRRGNTPNSLDNTLNKNTSCTGESAVCHSSIMWIVNFEKSQILLNMWRTSPTLVFQKFRLFLAGGKGGASPPPPDNGYVR